MWPFSTNQMTEEEVDAWYNEAKGALFKQYMEREGVKVKDPEGDYRKKASKLRELYQTKMIKIIESQSKERTGGRRSILSFLHR